MRREPCDAGSGAHARADVNRRLLTTRDVAGRLGVSPETVLRWIERRGLPARRLTSRAISFDGVELDAWLAERATAAPGRESASNPDRRRHPNGILPVPAIPLPQAARDEEV
jgi:excisionase family DNA binding protein